MQEGLAFDMDDAHHKHVLSWDDQIIEMRISIYHQARCAAYIASASAEGAGMYIASEGWKDDEHTTIPSSTSLCTLLVLYLDRYMFMMCFDLPISIYYSIPIKPYTTHNLLMSAY